MIVIIMGVSGCGKTTVGTSLAQRLGWSFLDADDLHPPANIAKMSAGFPLDDADREPWLRLLHQRLVDSVHRHDSLVLACSALKQRYREMLTRDVPGVQLVLLDGSYDDILTLMSRRTGHFMKPEMLASQFAALEKPEDALRIPVLLPVAEQVQRICDHVV